ncbi:protein of unknown function [Sterolibacterium denitrificans]|uniref:YgjP-like metallopeptidase domain-containing protein n=1 Tax=Sterolibacterium denitrificans TaxID=157592 RepID=A0A7Z7MVB8_9PROT|nr:YgjP-like metallopeptidase domain-containing protein [Sterolibacterium denitrificans]SMB26401.1 protein of unknown function [Sterolibacterium denitrificans]
MRSRKIRKQRNPQLDLWVEPRRLDPAERWCDGMRLPFLGGDLTLCLTTAHEMAAIEGETLHLPLPPGATPRQIQDGVEAWLRQEAAVLIAADLAAAAQRTNGAGTLPQWAFSFAAQGDWVQLHADGSLRFNWRLIELPRADMARIVAAAAADLAARHATADLWENDLPAP